MALGDSFLVRGRKHACMVAEPHNETSAVRHLVITSPRVTVQELTKDPIHALTDNKLWGAGFWPTSLAALDLHPPHGVKTCSDSFRGTAGG